MRERHVASRLAMTLIAVGLLAMPVAVLLGDEPRRFRARSRNGTAMTATISRSTAAIAWWSSPRRPPGQRPWIWRTEFFGHEPQADLALLAKGFHAVYIDVQNMYGAPAAMKHMDAFYDQLTRQHGLSKKTVLEGFSRGGLFAFNWAARHPDRVACIYVDAPVCDFKSWPGGKGKGPGSPGDWQNLLKVYGLTEAEAMAYRHNPIDNLAPLAKAGVPVLAVVGDADEVVPLDENTAIVEKRYKELGGQITVIVKKGVGHHPHSLVDPTPIVDFVLKHTAP